jgi:hypothetical protein
MVLPLICFALRGFLPSGRLDLGTNDAISIRQKPLRDMPVFARLAREIVSKAALSGLLARYRLRRF